jgi:ribulose-phosphate 3-epimerase
MDAHFVPPLTIGPVVVGSIRPITDRILHAHLMVARPERLMEDYAKAGTDILTFHTEAAREPEAVIREGEVVGLKVGMGVNPETPVEDVFPYLDRLDNVIVMTLESTGYAGQPFQPAALRKVEALREECERRGLTVDIVVDGGINEETGRRCVAAGATVLAAASSIFGAPDPGDAARRLAGVAREAGP